MNRDEAKHVVTVMQAWLDGATIENRRRGCEGEWIAAEPVWDWDLFEYRIKPEPREWVLYALSEGGMLHVGHNAPASCHAAIRVREVLE